MAEHDRFYIGMAAEAVLFVQEVDPVSGVKTPKPDLPTCTIRFLNPDGTELVEKTLADGVTNAGGGYYHAFAVPTQEGLHYVEGETGGVKPGRVKFTFSVEPF